ncbi:PREDICTED: uncharacterized protein LOC105137457 [Populus euphratica]|uniref:Uncharacterized protein LOC105137457 n=1 Tax=Populus euphratica TaxID=75702 RepID=A0AAJ6V5P6_POPEU|nr:PREDICTED: uncharacterized protein LOC105137457 [Populus euphratica]
MQMIAAKHNFDYLRIIMLEYTSRTTVVRHVTFVSSRLVGGPHCLFRDRTGHAADCSMPLAKNMFVFMLLYCNKLMLCGIHHPLKLQVLELGALLFHIADMKCFSVAVKPDDATCGPPTWIGKGLTCVCFKRKGAYERICINLTPQQEERLKRLKHRMKVYFDASRPDHQDALRALWSATYPDRELSGLKSDQWKEMGWQGRDPSTDFRGAGFISLENLLFFAKTFSTSFQYLLKKKGGKRSAWEYPFAVAGVNITFMIMQMLDLDSMKPRTFVRPVFLQILSGKKQQLHPVKIKVIQSYPKEPYATPVH